jgi:hypothetical protein
MTLTSFTNEPGVHYRREQKLGWQTRYYRYESDAVVESVFADDWNPIVEKSIKAFPTKSDGHRATYYNREVKKVVVDDPTITWETLTYPGEGLIFKRVRRYPISIDFDNLFEYECPGGDLTGGNALDESITKALNNLTANYVGAGADLGQAKQTVNELSHTATQIAQLLLAFKRLDFGYLTRGLSLRKAQKTIADIWLSYSYGFKPLASDLHELQELLKSELKKDKLVIGTGKGVEEYHQTDVGYPTRGGSLLSSYRRHKCRTVLKASIDNVYLANLSSLGVVNPAAIAWELVPWSFAIDWFVPIGSVLQACTAGVGLNFHGGYSSLRTELQVDVRPHKDYDVDYANFTGYKEGGRMVVQGYRFQRYAYTELPQARLYADLTPYSTPRALNALALVRQLA